MKHYFTRGDSSVFFNQLDVDWEALAAELSTWKVGQKGYMSFVKQSKPKSGEQLGYYYGLILPVAFEEFVRSKNDVLVFELKVKGKTKTVKLPLTKKNLDRFFKAQYSEFSGVYKDKGEMDMTECSFFEQYVIDWMFNWFDLVIPNANPNWKAELPENK